MNKIVEQSMVMCPVTGEDGPLAIPLGAGKNRTQGVAPTSSPPNLLILGGRQSA
jgi:hypothetical protein